MGALATIHSLVFDQRLSRRQLLKAVGVLLAFGPVSLGTAGCKPQKRTRPIGFLRLGALENFLAQETKLDQEWLIVRRDANGLSAMSTLCTKDLNAVSEKQGENGALLHCSLCGSDYTSYGKVLNGPAVADLPYFSLHVDSAQVGGPKDTLYARIGVEVSPDWRLRLIEQN